MPQKKEFCMKYIDYSDVLQETEQIIKECYMQFETDEVFLSFNGGKDCTVLLDITLHVLQDVHKRTDIEKDLKIVYIRTDSPFIELEAFVKQIEKHYGVNLIVSEGEMKSVLENVIKKDKRIKACLMGTRRTDPYSTDLDFMQPTDPGWPPLIRVSPLLNWSYQHIWSYILHRKVPYCSLYDKGYTSIGSTLNTRPNPSLAFKLKCGCVSYHPAWMLSDETLERAGRGAHAISTRTSNGYTECPLHVKRNIAEIETNHDHKMNGLSTSTQNGVNGQI